jgi:hypothetical protein
MALWAPPKRASTVGAGRSAPPLCPGWAAGPGSMIPTPAALPAGAPLPRGARRAGRRAARPWPGPRRRQLPGAHRAPARGGRGPPGLRWCAAARCSAARCSAARCSAAGPGAGQPLGVRPVVTPRPAPAPRACRRRRRARLALLARHPVLSVPAAGVRLAGPGAGRAGGAGAAGLLGLPARERPGGRRIRALRRRRAADLRRRPVGAQGGRGQRAGQGWRGQGAGAGLARGRGQGVPRLAAQGKARCRCARPALAPRLLCPAAAPQQPPANHVPPPPPPAPPMAARAGGVRAPAAGGGHLPAPQLWRHGAVWPHAAGAGAGLLGAQQGAAG